LLEKNVRPQKNRRIIGKKADSKAPSGFKYERQVFVNENSSSQKPEIFSGNIKIFI